MTRRRDTVEVPVREHVTHGFPPFWQRDAGILILGSFPSVRSREPAFFYGHPRNRFWQVLAAVRRQPCPQTIEEKKAFLAANHIALYDTLEACDIRGSADSSIANAEPADLRPILEGAAIRRIFTNGRTSQKYYDRWQAPVLHREAVCLPSTSPANAAWSLTQLTEAWSVINTELEEK